MRIAIGADHAGFETKQTLTGFLRQKGHQVEDMGTNSSAPCDYPDFALKVAEAVSQKRAERGIVICGNGIGMAIVANKVPGVRAALVFTEKMAKDTVEHNNSNVLSLAGRDLPVETNLKLAQTWLETSFKNEERHVRRVEKITDVEKKYLKNI
jgi:ribose 5-phosphate isomerase B